MAPGNEGWPVHQRVVTSLDLGGDRIHRFQVVRERREGGRVEEWIVVGLEAGTVRLADPGFEWDRELGLEAFRDGPYEPLTAGGVPVWGY